MYRGGEWAFPCLFFDSVPLPTCYLIVFGPICCTIPVLNFLSQYMICLPYNPLPHNIVPVAFVCGPLPYFMVIFSGTWRLILILTSEFSFLLLADSVLFLFSCLGILPCNLNCTQVSHLSYPVFLMIRFTIFLGPA